ncbi:MAG: lysylphosphatidylglycerol synthase domain-containing protein [Gemmatimonadota bacterium]
MKVQKWAGRWSRWRLQVIPILNLSLFGLAIWMVDRVVGEYPYARILGALREIPIGAMALSLLLTLAGYLALVGYDRVALLRTSHDIPLRRTAIPSFVSIAVSNSAPASVVTAGGLRYRLFRPLGVTGAEAAGMAVFNMVTWLTGISTLAGLVLLIRNRWPSTLAGAAILLAPTTYFLMTHLARGPIRMLRWTIPLPSGAVVRRQFAVSLTDWLLSSAALYVLIRGVAPVSYLGLLSAFFLAQTVTLSVPVPGGIGVFEAVVLLAIPEGETAPPVLAALFAYRVIYYLIPLVMAGALLAARGILESRTSDLPRGDLLARASTVAHTIVAGVTLVAGMVLLTGGAIPVDEVRLAWISGLLPLSVLELSHFLGSVAGAGLLILAWGLQRRIHRAYIMVRSLFGAGIVLALLRSFDLFTATLLCLALLVLLAAGKAFPREASLLREPMDAGWAFALGAVIFLNFFVGLQLQERLGFSGETWWHFALLSHGPRAARAGVGAGVVLLLFVLARVLAQAVQDAPSHAGQSDPGMPL